MQRLPLRDLESIWLRRIFLPAGLLFYCVSVCAVFLAAIAVAGPLHGVARVWQLAGEGHLAAGAALALQSIVGFAVLRGLGWNVDASNAEERWLFAIVAGFALSDAVLLGLALAGCLEAAWIAGIAAASIAAAAVLDRSGLVRVRSSLRWERGRASALEIAAGGCALLAIATWLWPLMVQTALPNSDWDSALYHLPLAERYLAGKVWNFDPLFSANSFPGGVSLVYAAFLAFGLEHAIIPYNFLFVLLNLVAAHALARRLGGPRCGAWALFVCAGVHVLWQQGVDPRVDGFLSFFIAVAMLALAIALRERSNTVPLYLLSLALGCAIGTKYTGLFIALAFAATVAVAIAWRRIRADAQPGIASLGLCVALALVPNGVWYASNTLLHGDPLFPMLRGDYYTMPGAPERRIAMDGALDGKLADLPPAARMRAKRLSETAKVSTPTNLFDWIDLARRPQAYATRPNHFVSPLLLLFLALPLALPRDRARRNGALVLFGLTAVCFAGLGSQTNLVRYALPFLVLAAAGAGIVLGRITHPAWSAGWFACGLLVLASHQSAEIRKLARLQPGRFATSDADRLEWLETVGYNFTPAMPIVIQAINAKIATGEISRESKILMVGEGKGRLLDCESLPDLSWFLQRWTVELIRADDDPVRILQSLRAQGVSHILYNPGYFRWVVAHTDTSVEQIAYAMVRLESFMAHYGSPVLEAAGMRLVALEDSDGSG